MRAVLSAGELLSTKATAKAPAAATPAAAALPASGAFMVFSPLRLSPHGTKDTEIITSKPNLRGFK